MDTTVLPCKTILPPKISEKPTKPKSLSKNSSHNPAGDARLKRLCNLGRLRDAIFSLDSCGSTVRPSTLSYLIESCIDSNSLDLCHELHARILNLVDRPDPFLQTKLVGMFAKCGSLGDAFAVFDVMRERNLYTWSAIIGACSRERMWGDVVDLFYWMMEEGSSSPDNFLFPKILQACGNRGDSETGRLIHGITVKRGISDDLRVNNSILAVYAKCRQLSCANRFFEKMEVKDKVSWNAIISGFCLAGRIDEARKLLESMRDEGFGPDAITWNLLITSCNHLGRCDLALSLMNEMENLNTRPDVYTWTSMISGLAQNNRTSEALKLFVEMLTAGFRPNSVTVMNALSACTSGKDFRRGNEVHSVAVKLGYGEDMLVGNSLIDMYSKSGKLESAKRVFDLMTEKDMYTWNSMIGGYCQAGYCGVAHYLFKKMQKSGFLPNVVTWNVMITGYIKNGDEDQAMDLFYEMEESGGIKRDTASWNALIAGYVDMGEKDKALRILRKMQYCGVKPNYITILSILPAFANLVCLKKLKEIHCFAVRSIWEYEIFVANALIDTYSKAGNIKYSKVIFYGMPIIDVITWNAMITGFVLHGFYNEAIELFERMRKMEYKPTRSTFVSVLSAYGLAKRVDEGRHIFSCMSEELEIVPCVDHYVAMVNLYGRSGKIDKAFDFVGGMPIEPNASIWSALLTLSLRHEKVQLAVYAAEKLLELEPDNGFVRTLVLRLYELHGISRDDLKVKKVGVNIRKNTPKIVGSSWVEDKNAIRTFVSGDPGRMAADHEYLLSWIGKVELNIQDLKYRDVFRVLDEEHEEVAGIHSEKLALAFALVECPPREFRTVRIVKNLRMCDRCHQFFKLVSKTYCCEIYVSDTRCLHRFEKGICSCGDYW
ncbi:pentatricopeptide repeat-containing family protein [Striga asiatica]|uniref:Pentatricopeptide repeat-containing family protein n=1 Tax=Striga asiatica TaxID=4170 RepID=A0A5A7RIQ5_STRAF|nr:pentatricopeptide repeat-containing family protein [Striga asiatica]